MSEHKLNILVIDDDLVYRNVLRSLLKERCDVLTVEAPSLAFKVLASNTVDVVICDFVLPEMNGLKVLDTIKEQYPHIEVIMISATGEMDTVIQALRRGASDYFKKPFTAQELWLALERTKRFAALSQRVSTAEKKNSALKALFSHEHEMNLVGTSPAIASVKEQMKMVAQTPDTSVLIIGESGTGKELIARGIHDLSRRKGEIFAAVNMSAIPESLFESEFFGHKKGSFTGAITDKAGWFESANGGTLFFDEIGEMTLGLQVKLLRVLEDRTLVKVGTQKEQPFDIRIVSATNMPVAELEGGKNFRLDLFHRLGTFIIELPPLRDRRSDIPDLTEFFLCTIARKMGKHISSVHPSVYELFDSYSFPGNIRELRNLVERAIIMCQCSKLEAQHFTASAWKNSLRVTTAPDVAMTFDLQEIEKQTIVRALEKVKYNKAEASRLLNIEWNALHRRIQKHSIAMPAE